MKKIKNKKYLVFGFILLFIITISLSLMFNLIGSNETYKYTNTELINGNFQIKVLDDVVLSEIDIFGTITKNYVIDRKIDTIYGLVQSSCQNDNKGYIKLIYSDGTNNQYNFNVDDIEYVNPNQNKVVSTIQVYVNKGSCVWTKIHAGIYFTNLNYYTSGNVETTSYITTTQPYNNFELQTTQNLNGGDIKPYLIIGNDKHYLVNGKLNIPTVIAGTQIKRGFDFVGLGSSTPTLNKDMVLLGSYGDEPVAEVSSSGGGGGSSEEEIIIDESNTDNSNNVINTETNEDETKTINPFLIVGIIIIIIVIVSLISKKLGGKKRY